MARSESRHSHPRENFLLQHPAKATSCKGAESENKPGTPEKRSWQEIKKNTVRQAKGQNGTTKGRFVRLWATPLSWMFYCDCNQRIGDWKMKRNMPWQGHLLHLIFSYPTLFGLSTFKCLFLMTWSAPSRTSPTSNLTNSSKNPAPKAETPLDRTSDSHHLGPMSGRLDHDPCHGPSHNHGGPPRSAVQSLEYQQVECFLRGWK